MKDLLYVKDYYRPVFLEAKMDSKSEDEWKISHLQACGFIRQFVEDNTLNHISDVEDGRLLWKKLEELYGRKESVNKMLLIKRLMHMRYPNGSSMADHLSNFQGVVNELTGMGISFEEEVQALLLLGSLPESWETLKVNLCNTAPGGVVTWELVKAKLLNEEARHGSSMEANHVDVLATDARGRRLDRDQGKSASSSGRSKSRPKSSKSTRPNVECFHCHKKGHMRKDCWKLKKEGATQNLPGRIENDGAVNVLQVQPARREGVGVELIILHDDSINRVGEDHSGWILDSGATVHCTSHRSLFSAYTPGNHGEARMADDQTIRIIGMGEVHLRLTSGSTLTLKNVHHVERLRLNIISVGQLDEDGYCCSIGASRYKITKGCLVIARGDMEDHLYRLRAKLSKAQVSALRGKSVQSADDDEDLCGHPSQEKASVPLQGEYSGSGGDPEENCPECPDSLVETTL